jgi:restriction system protein
MQRQTIDRKKRRSRFVPIQSGGHGSPAAVASSLEGQIARLFRRLGYRVRHRPATHDSGVDLDLARPGLRAIVQCKHWSRPVGPSVVRDLYGTLLHTGADLGILATTSTVSRSAQRFAQGKPLLLLDGALLQLLLPNSS